MVNSPKGIRAIKICNIFYNVLSGIEVKSSELIAFGAILNGMLHCLCGVGEGGGGGSAPMLG